MIKRCTIVLTLLTSFSASAQRTSADTAFLARSIAQVSKNYLRAVKGESSLYTGSDYAEYAAVGDEDPFYLSNDWLMGDIHYNGFLYRDVPLQYDISTQRILTEHLTSAKKIQLVDEKVSFFDIQGHHFVRVDQTKVKSFGEDPGFYDLLVDGKTKLYARRQKNIQRNVVAGKLEATFEEVTKFYIEHNNKFYPVKSKGSALSVLPDKKSELQKALKHDGVKFSKNRESALTQTVKIYNYLSGQHE